MGYSVGRWDGDTLVVESNGFNDRTWLDMGGHLSIRRRRGGQRHACIGARGRGHLPIQRSSFSDSRTRERRAVRRLPWSGTHSENDSISTSLYIDGVWRATAGRPIDVYDPRNEQVIAPIASGSASDVPNALAAARRAQRDWARRPAAEARRLFLRWVADLVRTHRDALAHWTSVMALGRQSFSVRRDGMSPGLPEPASSQQCGTPCETERVTFHP